jgi:intracellular septation protein A
VRQHGDRAGAAVDLEKNFPQLMLGSQLCCPPVWSRLTVGVDRLLPVHGHINAYVATYCLTEACNFKLWAMPSRDFICWPGLYISRYLKTTTAGQQTMNTDTIPTASAIRSTLRAT